jgi:hypothetical protein
MAYLLLLGFLGSLAFIYAAPGRGPARLATQLGFGLLAVSLLAQLVLSFDLEASFARLFYLARYMLAAAWLGLALLLALFPKHSLAKPAIWALAAASAASLVLIGATQLTQAQDWYQPAAPAYSQIHELLATNRPTRWGAAALSIAGLFALVVGVVSLLRSRQFWRAALLAAGVAALAAPLLWSPRLADLAFYAVETAAPLLLCLGFAATPAARSKGRRKK